MSVSRDAVRSTTARSWPASSASPVVRGLRAGQDRGHQPVHNSVHGFERYRSNPATYLEPPIGIEPMTYALRGACSLALMP